MISSFFINTGHRVLRLAVDGPAEGEPLVFIHSLGCDLDLWQRVAAPLSARYRTIRYDLRGHGLSDCGPPECSIEDHVGDLAALLDSLSVDRVTQLGISVGGLIAQAFALRYPMRVRQLVLCATGVRNGTREGWTERIAQVKTKGLEAMADTLVARWFGPDFAAREPALYRGCRNRLARTPDEGYIATCAALRDADLRGASSGITAPALVISGECDVPSPPEAGRELAGLLANASFEMIRGVGHLPPLENPAVTLSLIESFLNSSHEKRP